MLIDFLLQLFDIDHTLNKQASSYIFTTEGHLLRLDPELRQKSWKLHERNQYKNAYKHINRAVARINESQISSSVSTISILLSNVCHCLLCNLSIAFHSVCVCVCMRPFFYSYVHLFFIYPFIS